MTDAEPSSVLPVPISEHSRVLIAMHKISARFRLLPHQLSARLWQDTRGHLRDEAAAFERVLVEHLDREEAVVVPPLESLLSEADQHPLSKQEAKLSTYRHLGLAVPWVLANATPEEAASLRATAPRLLGVIQDRVWEPRFARVLVAPAVAVDPALEPHARRRVVPVLAGGQGSKQARRSTPDGMPAAGHGLGAPRYPWQLADGCRADQRASVAPGPPGARPAGPPGPATATARRRGFSIPSGTPAQVPAPTRPAEPSGQPG